MHMKISFNALHIVFRSTVTLGSILSAGIVANFFLSTSLLGCGGPQAQTSVPVVSTPSTVAVVPVAPPTTVSQVPSSHELTPAGPAPDCWKGFAPTGNAAADVAALGERCATGMSSLIPPVKYSFRAGESKSFPVPFVSGCYRIIAVGGTGVKDVDLELRDNTGRIVAADNTPDDIMPMLHPNKELCLDGLQLLNLSILVKKGTGEVAGAVWKR